MSFIPLVPESLEYEGILRTRLAGIYFHTHLLGVKAHVVSSI